MLNGEVKKCVMFFTIHVELHYIQGHSKNIQNIGGEGGGRQLLTYKILQIHLNIRLD